MTKFSQQFYAFMNSIPFGEYAAKRNELMAHMGWSYWAYLRRLNGNVFISKSSRDKIEEFFNTKIFD